MAGIISDTNRVGGVPQSASRHVAMSTCFDVYFAGDALGSNASYHLIGFISQLNITNTRTVTQIRHLNSADAGIAIDTVVTPDAPTLAFNGFYVYSDIQDQSSDITETTGVSITQDNKGVGPTIGRVAGVQLLMSLDQQTIPFDVVVRHAYSTVGGTTQNNNSNRIIGVYKNCTISNMTTPINIGAAAIADSGTLSVGYVASAY